MPRRLPSGAAALAFLKTDSASGIILALCALAGMVVANGPLAARYVAILAHELTLPLGFISISLSVSAWVKDGLMTIFFFVVGLELKRELVEGELSDPRAVTLPIAAALGGMVVPAGVYLLINAGGDARGWPLPVATDIAFAVAALALIGRRAPSSLRIFLLTLAIVDDLGAVLLIAVIFSHGIAWLPLCAALIVLVLMTTLGRWREAPPWLYGLGALIVWVFALHSGVHTSVAGAAAAFTVPVASWRGGPSTLARLEDKIHPISAYAVLPLFAFVSAGIPLASIALSDLLTPMPVGIALGLLIGKPLGILFATFAVTKTGLARLPSNTDWREMFAVSCLCGIGFTMSLFLAALAFSGDTSAEMQARLAIIAGSLLSLAAGVLIFMTVRKPETEDAA